MAKAEGASVVESSLLRRKASKCHTPQRVSACMYALPYCNIHTALIHPARVEVKSEVVWTERRDSVGLDSRAAVGAIVSEPTSLFGGADLPGCHQELH